jgi:uncharacterized membrane protein
MRHTILAVLGGLTGAALADEEGAIADVLAALLAATVIGLTHRVQQLERALSALKSTAEQPNDVSLSPLPEPLSPTDQPSSASTLFTRLGDAIKNIFTGGNIVVRVGLIIVFFSVAFALRVRGRR